MSVSDPRVCPECGSDTYFAQEFERMRDRCYRIKDEYERQAARFAVERAKWQLEQFENQEDRKGLQGKVHRQRQVINRLEKKLRKLGVAPHAPGGAGGEQ